MPEMNLNISYEGKQNIKKLKEYYHLKSDGEVIRTALNLLSEALEAAKKDQDIIIRNIDRELKIYVGRA